LQSYRAFAQQCIQGPASFTSTSRLPWRFYIYKSCNQFHPSFPLDLTLPRLDKQYGRGDKEGWRS